MKKHSFSKTALAIVVLLLVSLMSVLVSCPNNTIAGSVERDGRNNAETLITGTINKPLTDSRKFTVTLNNATFRAFSRGEDVSFWFVDSEGKSASIVGLKYRIASPVASGSNKATIRITGTPETASKDQIHLLIPCDTFQGPITIDVDTEGALRYNIIDYIEPTLTLIKEEGNNLVIDGMETKVIDEKRIKFQLNNAHFANSLKGNISVAYGGDGTIIGAKSGGINFDDATDSAHLDFKWEIIENPNGDNTEIDLVITGTADKLRSLNDGDTFTITLKESVLYDGTDATGNNSTPTIIDDNNGEAYVKDIKVVKEGTTTPEVGVYNFTEVVPTLALVELNGTYTNYLSSWNKSSKKEISGTTDKTAGLGFNSVELYYLLSDATVTNTSTSGTFTNDKVDSLFGEGFSKTGLGGSIRVRYSELNDDNGSAIANSPVLFVVIISKGAEDLHVSEGDFNFVLTDELINTFGIKKNGATENYDKPIKSSGIISIKIEEPKPAIESKADNRKGVYFTATTLDVVSDNPYNVTNGVNGGVIKLQNYSTFRYKAEYATGQEVKIDGENSLVKIEPTYDYMTYYYKVLTSDEDPDQASIQLYVKNNPEKYEDGDPNEGILTPPSLDVTYTEDTSRGTDNQNMAYGDFDSSMKDKYQVQVTLSPKLFEQVDTGEIATMAEGDTETKWKDYTGSDVVITKESNWVRYRIREKKTISLVSSWIYLTDASVGYKDSNVFNEVINKDASGNVYVVTYTNSGIANFGDKKLRFSAGGGTTADLKGDSFAYNDSYNTIWTVIPKALPKSPVGSLMDIGEMVDKTTFFKNNFNTPLYHYDEYDEKDKYTGVASKLYFRFRIGNSINGTYNNVSLNRFQIVGAIPEGYTLDPDTLTENDVRIFSAVKNISTNRINYTVPVLYNSDEMAVINKHVKFKVALDKTEGVIAKNPASTTTATTWKTDMSGKTPFYLYLDEFTDENSELTNILKGYYEEKTSDYGTSRTDPIAPVLAYLDIRINPSKLINNQTNEPYLSKKKAEKTVDGSVYNGDTSKLMNGDMWLPIAQSPNKKHAKKIVDDAEYTAYYKPIPLKIYVSPKQYEVNGQTYKALSWQYRIMDRADYTYLTANHFTPADEDTIKNEPYKTNYRHSQTSLSVNADMTTGLTKNLGKGLTLDSDGKTYGFGEKQLQTNQYDSSKVYSSFVLPLIFSSYSRYGLDTNYKRLEGLIDNSDYAKMIDRDLPYDNRSIPIRELQSGSFAQDEYNENNASGRTIPGSDLLNIAKSASRKGYRVKGFSRGRNHIITTVTPTESAFGGTTNIYSDLVPYKGVDDFGNTVDWEIYWNGNAIDETSPVFEKGITLGLTDSAAYRQYIYPKEDYYGLSDSSFADWYNTTYIYLVWEQDPNSVYYNKDNTNIAMGNVQFVRIPGELQWPGYRNPYYIKDGQLEDVDYTYGPNDLNSGGNRNRVGIREDVAPEFESVRRIADYDYAISDREFPAGLFKTVYDWAIGNGYVFSNSEETYIPINKNQKEMFNSSSMDQQSETSSFDINNIYGGTRTPGTYESDPIVYAPVETNKDEHPVTNVNLYDAMLFCNALTAYSNKNWGTQLEPAYGYFTTYYDIKNNYATVLLNSVKSDGYRLPTFNEWFAAASIVPNTDDFLKTATATRLEEFQLADNSYDKYRAPVTNGGLLRYNPKMFVNGNYPGIESARKEMYYDTSYPFMQTLNGVSGTNFFCYESYNGGDALSKAQQYSWANRDSESRNAILTSTRAVATGKPNSLGLYDMSGNVAEWTATPSGAIMIVGGDWCGDISNTFLMHNIGNRYYSTTILPSPSYTQGNGGSYSNDRVYDSKNYNNGNKDKGITSRTLPLNQRSYNVGFRVCRTIKDSTV